jgi:fatty-acyl-CoA synthase
VPVDGVGELCIRGGFVMDGYWKRPAETAEALRDGWLHTGDLASRDEDGFIRIVDRKRDMIISGAFNIFPREIEEVLAVEPTVSAAAVIGVPDDKWGEAVTAFVVPRPGQTIDVEALQALVRQRKGRHQVPKQVFVMDSLPLTAVGKIDKKQLRSRFWNTTDRAVN